MSLEQRPIRRGVKARLTSFAITCARAGHEDDHRASSSARRGTTGIKPWVELNVAVS